jgi:hypothetical protein
MSQIIIPIEKSTNATSSFNTNNLFQQDALSKIKNLILKNLNVTKNYNYPEENCFDRFHNSITILGERGTGKTSFLLNLETSFKEDAKYSNIEEKLEFLDSLDPTLFEDKQNIIVSIITLIADKIKVIQDSIEKEKWTECLTELSDGLNLLDGIGSNPMQKDLWDDSRIILDKGLTSAHSGINFEKNFHKFVDKSLKLLNKKEMFILRFDDIDTSVLKGWPVLEVIRKYLTTPKIQIIISGDINLFSKLVRLKQWENLEKLVPYENKENLNSTIDQLEEQYLTKILKPEYRIYLQSLESILKRHPNIIEIEYLETLTHIEDIYNDIAEKVFILERDSDKEIFINTLLKLPIRTNLQILMAYYNNMYNSINMELFLDDFALIFMTNFTKFDFKYEDTFTLISHKNEIINYLIEKLIFIKNFKDIKSINDLKSLQPIFKDKDLNLFLLYLNANIVYSISNSTSTIFDWFLKKFYFFKILEFTISENIDENLAINYLGINTPLIYASTKINGILYQNNGQYDSFAKVYLQERQVKDGGLGFDTYLKKLKTDLEKDYNNEYNNFLVIHSIIFSKIRIKNDSETYLNVSILNIFSFLGATLALDYNSKHFEIELQNLLEDKTIGKFDVENVYGDIITDKIKSILNIENSKFFVELKNWISLYSKVKPFSVRLIEDIWTEFYEREKLIYNVNRVNNYLEAQIFVFFNSIFKNIKKHRNINSSTRLIRGYNKARDRFESNIKGTEYENVYKLDLNDKDLKIDFLEYMLLCPLWKYLINYPVPIDFKYNLMNPTDPLISYYDYLGLLSLHQGLDNSTDKNLLTTQIKKEDSIVINENEESSWPDKALTKAKIRRYIQKGNFNLSNKNIINDIWEKIKYEEKIRGDIHYSGREERIKEVIDEFLDKEKHE